MNLGRSSIRRRSSSTRYLLWSLAWVGHFALATEAVEFYAEGELKASETGSQPHGFRFSASVSNQCWLIRSQPEVLFTDPARAIYQYMESGTDGTNIFSISVFNDRYDLRRSQEESVARLKARERTLSNSGANAAALKDTRYLLNRISGNLTSTNAAHVYPSNGGIYPGVIPRFSSDDFIAIIWLAFCSQSYFQSAPENVAPAYFSEPAVIPLTSNLLVHAEWTLSADRPYCPSHISFLGDRYYLAPAESPLGQVVPLNARPGPAGIRTEYESLATREYGRVVLPEIFQMVREVRGIGPGGSNQPISTFRVRGTVLRGSSRSATAEWQPRIMVPTMVQDYRFLNENYQPTVRYALEAGARWPGQENVRSTRQYARSVLTAKTRYERVHRTTFMRRTTAWAIFLGASVVLPAVWLLKSKLCKKN